MPVDAPEIPGVRFSKLLATAALTLLSMWFVPEVLSSPPVFAFQLIGRCSGGELPGLLANPVAACLVLLLLVLPLPNRSLSLPLVTMLVGVAAVLLPVLSLYSLPVERTISIPAIVVGTALGIAASCAFASPLPGYLVLSLVPAGLLLTALYGAVFGEASSVYLSAIKNPISLFAAMLITAVSGARVIKQLGEEAAARDLE